MLKDSAPSRPLSAKATRILREFGLRFGVVRNYINSLQLHSVTVAIDETEGHFHVRACHLLLGLLLRSILLLLYRVLLDCPLLCMDA